MTRGNIYVGIDLHKENFTYVMLSSTGTVTQEGKRTTEQGDVAAFAATLTASHQVVLEPLLHCWWFVEQLVGYAGSVHVANSHKVRLIAASKLKNDRIDARILADLLRVGYLPEVYIPSADIIGQRRLVNYRVRLVRDRTRLKNRILTLIQGEGLRVQAKDAFGKRGRGELDALPLSPATREMVDTWLVHLDLLSADIEQLDRRIAAFGDDHPIVSLLRTIDGLGMFTAVAIYATVGEMARFRSAKAFAAYTGLVPGYRASAGIKRNGPITKQGVTTLRWVLIQAVPHAVRHSLSLQRLYHRIRFRSSVGKAKVAVAHALARIIYHVWMEARPYYR